MVSTTLDDARVRTRSWFYVRMASAFVFIAFAGFVPTYWAKLATGTFGGAPILHIHGTLFFTWTLFYLMQTTLVATGRTPEHRTWGLVGISLATAMSITIVLAAINSMKAAEAIGMGDQARRFSIVSLSGLVLFATCVGFAIANVKRPEIHKRLMIVAMIPLMHAATARIFKTLVAPDAVGPPPVFVAIPPGLIVDLLLVVAIVHDWRTRGRPHPVYLYGLAVLVTQQALFLPISGTHAWMAIARGVEALAG